MIKRSVTRPLRQFSQAVFTEGFLQKQFYEPTD